MMNARRRQRAEGRLGSILAIIGCLGLLGFTFGAGFYSGRFWTRAASASSTAAPQASAAPEPRGPAAVAPGVIPPALTFYEELTAPLSPTSPPAPKLAAAELRRAVDKPDLGVARVEDKAGRSEKRDAPARKAEPETSAPRFTVQIAAYSVRASAEALRSTITATGHEAYIVENDGPAGVPRYRVRVGSYPTREAAIAAAARLPVAGARYVTSR